MPSKKSITILDVAKTAGVSPATVSRVLSSNAYVIDETREKVLDAIEKTGYRVLKPKSKPAKSAKSILVICSSLRDQGSSYFLEGIERRISEAGYSSYIKHLMMSEIIHGAPGAETILSWVRDCGASGLLIFSDAVDKESVHKLSSEMPVVAMMTECSDMDVSSVDVDEEDMMRQSIQHLVATGKSKIALITGQPKYRRSITVTNIYKSMLEKMGLESNPDWCANIDTNYFSTSAAIVAEQMLRSPNPPDAFIATADIFAAGVIYACNRLGLNVPDDVAVVGRDNSSICHVCTPQITSFNMPSEMIGYTACNNLIVKMEDPESSARNVVLSCDLIIRESTNKNILL